MTRIILNSYSGEAVLGIANNSFPLTKFIIYKEDPHNLLGFLPNRRFSTKVGEGDQLQEFVEVSYFMEMLYYGNLQAYIALSLNKGDITYSSLEYDMLVENKGLFISQKLVDNVLEESEEMFGKIGDNGKDNFKVREKENKKISVELLAYNIKNSYICISKLMVLKNILHTGDANLTENNTAVLHAILDGALSKDSISEMYESLREEILELADNPDIPAEANDVDINELLLKIRNLEIKEVE